MNKHINYINFATSQIMNFYEKAITKSELFIKDNILKYDQLRNYDFGPTKRDNVSGHLHFSAIEFYLNII